MCYTGKCPYEGWMGNCIADGKLIERWKKRSMTPCLSEMRESDIEDYWKTLREITKEIRTEQRIGDYWQKVREEVRRKRMKMTIEKKAYIVDGIRTLLKQQEEIDVSERELRELLLDTAHPFVCQMD